MQNGKNDINSTERIKEKGRNSEKTEKWVGKMKNRDTYICMSTLYKAYCLYSKF